MTFKCIAFKYTVSYWLLLLIDHHAEQNLCMTNFTVLSKAHLPQASFLYYLTLKIQSGNVIEDNIKLLIEQIPPGLKYLLLDQQVIGRQFIQCPIKMV